MNYEGFVDYSLFELIDNVIENLEKDLSDLEWGLCDDARVERLKMSLDTLYERRDSGEVLLPRF